MAGVGERKRKAGIDLDFNQLLDRDDEPPAELLILGTAEKSMPPPPPPHAEEVESQVDNYIRNLSDKELMEKIKRYGKFSGNLPDGGEKLRAKGKKMEAELRRRSLEKKDDNKCKEVIAIADESTCNGATDDFSHYRAPPSKSASEFGLRFCSKLDERPNECFIEELSILSRSDDKKIREHKPFSAQITQKKDFFSRQTPFRSPSSLSANIDNGEQRGSYSSNPSSQPSDKYASCHLTKKESGPYSLRSLISRRNNRKIVDLVDEEELEVDVIDETDQVCQSNKDARIYYPSRDDPEAIEICYSDLECLAPESYLSSPIMNFYIRYLQKPTSPSARKKCDYHVFNTYFYEKLKQDVLTKTDTEDLFCKFRRWWKGVNIFEKAYVFLPIHEEHHWSLVIICIPNKEDESGPIILHLDSLGLHNSKSIFSNVRSFLIEEWEFLRKKEVDVLPELPFTQTIWNRLSRRIDDKVIEVPQQKNAYDCGLFVLYFMERFMDEAPERLKKRDLEMFGREWFRPGEASSLRRKIRDLLREEFKKAKEETCELES